MKKLSLITVAVSLSIFSVGVMENGMRQSRYESHLTNIIVGKTQSTMGPHGGSIGAPGIGSRFMRNGKTISFSGLKNLVTQKRYKRVRFGKWR
ncbi:hypothetical protein AB6F61_13270 [Providencia hangzhouensis]|uniref:hypothetical protein n=1 Tax=Providencia hangzhouensis TaxID=3031799 RepID=UPI0034DD7B8E